MVARLNEHASQMQKVNAQVQINNTRSTTGRSESVKPNVKGSGVA